MKLKDGFFRVNPLSVYIPITGTWHAVESDDKFTLYKNGVQAATYAGISRGMGKILSVYNRGYVLFDNGANQIRIIDDFGNQKTLLTITADDHSVIVFDKCFVVMRRNGTSITATSYLIAGVASDPYAQQLDSKTTTALREDYNMCSAKFNSTEAYVLSDLETGVAQRSLRLKMVSGDYEGKIEGLIWETGYLVNTAPIPFAGATIGSYPGLVQAYYNPGFNYYAEVKNNGNRPGYNTSVDVTIKRLNGTVVYSGNINTAGSGNGPVTTRIYMRNDNSGTGKITMVWSRGSIMIARIYSLANGALTLLAESSNDLGTTPPSSICRSVWLFPLFDDHMPDILMYQGGSYRRKVSFSGSTITWGTPVNSTITTTFSSNFGSRIWWL